MPDLTPVKYETIKVGAGDRVVTFSLAWGPAARYLMQKWGFRMAGESLPIQALAAAMAGTLDASGRWVSARLESPIDLIEMMGPDQHENDFAPAVLATLKNIAPGATTTLVGGDPAPAQ